MKNFERTGGHIAYSLTMILQNRGVQPPVGVSREKYLLRTRQLSYIHVCKQWLRTYENYNAAVLTSLLNRYGLLTGQSFPEIYLWER